jgi:pSer/pThr/pTyr-binding forkhead associated (FHA) protein
MPRAAHRVSRRHCCLRWDGGRRVTLEDCGSANGTFLADGRRLPAGQPAPLQPGDRFYLGNRDHQFQLEWDQP